MNKINSLIQQFNINIRKSKKAKHIAIKIVNQRVELVIPFWVPVRFGHKFLISKKAWIENKLKNHNLLKSDIYNDQCPILGINYHINHIEINSKEKVIIEGNYMNVYSSKENLNSTLKKFCKKIITEEIHKLSNYYATKHKLNFNKIAIKEMKTKWGSCSSLKNLSFNWRIVFAPKNVVEYLVIHELCHLKIMNHSEKYWKLVEEIYPNYKEPRLWLRNNGSKLYYYL